MSIPNINKKANSLSTGISNKDKKTDNPNIKTINANRANNSSTDTNKKIDK